MKSSKNYLENELVNALSGNAKRSDVIGDCPVHGQYETVGMLLAGKWRVGECPSCREQRFAQNLAMLAAERAAAKARAEEALRVQRLGGAAIPKRFADRGFENYLVENDGQRRALKVCRAYAERFDNMRQSGTNLIMCGLPGTGKTHLACAIGNEVLRAGHTALFRSVTELLDSVRDTWRKGSEESQSGIYKRLAEIDLLIVDEVGVQLGTDAEKLILFEIFDRRYKLRMPSIMLSNLSHDQLARYAGERVIERFSEGGAMLPFTWESFRTRASEFHNRAAAG